MSATPDLLCPRRGDRTSPSALPGGPRRGSLRLTSPWAQLAPSTGAGTDATVDTASPPSGRPPATLWSCWWQVRSQRVSRGPDSAQAPPGSPRGDAGTRGRGPREGQRRGGRRGETRKNRDSAEGPERPKESRSEPGPAPAPPSSLQDGSETDLPSRCGRAPRWPRGRM